MNHYAAEQLTRQRHDQFAQEVRGDHLMRAALNVDASADATVGRSSTRDVGGLIKRIRERLVAGRPEVVVRHSHDDHRMIGTRHV